MFATLSNIVTLTLTLPYYRLVVDSMASSRNHDFSNNLIRCNMNEAIEPQVIFCLTF